MIKSPFGSAEPTSVQVPSSEPHGSGSAPERPFSDSDECLGVNPAALGSPSEQTFRNHVFGGGRLKPRD
jgi:hypothetical protein